MGFIFLGITLAVLLLLIHHKYIHSDPHNLQYIQDPCQQWFQWQLYPQGDVCNFQTCSHEMAIIGLLLVGTAAIFIITLEDCGGKTSPPIRRCATFDLDGPDSCG